MYKKRNYRLKILIGLIALLLTNLACMYLTINWCEYWEGGEWVVKLGRPEEDGCCRTAERKCEGYDLPQYDNSQNSNNSAEENESQNAQACNATQYLQVTGVVVTEQYTDQYDTQICKFTLSIQSTHATDPIRYFYYQHKKDVYQGTESYQWMGNFPLSPYGETDWLGNIAIYNEKDAQGPVMSIPVKIAGIFDSPECRVYYKDAVFDEAFLESIAIPITSPCPLE